MDGISLFFKTIDMPERELVVECRLAAACAEKGETVYSFGKRIGIHPNQLYSYSAGTLPSMKVALYIAKELGVSVEDIWKLS